MLGLAYTIDSESGDAKVLMMRERKKDGVKEALYFRDLVIWHCEGIGWHNDNEFDRSICEMAGVNH